MLYLSGLATRRRDKSQREAGLDAEGHLPEVGGRHGGVGPSADEEKP